MDLDLLHKLSFCGHTLNVEERAALEVSFAKRQAEEGLAEVLFWGKISGDVGAYLVAVGLLPSGDDVPAKKFFFCTSSNYALQELPELNAEEERHASGVRGRFRGDPAHVVAEYESKGGEEDDEPSKVTEAHRLAFAVRRIDAATSTVPRGAFVADPTQRVRRNFGFGGLDRVAAGDMSNYYHFRAGHAPARLEAAGKDGLQASVDFLDPLSGDEPKGVWALQWSDDMRQVTLRSLLWPGYFFFHDVSTPKFGSAYFGDGLENVDLPFML